MSPVYRSRNHVWLAPLLAILLLANPQLSMAQPYSPTLADAIFGNDVEQAKSLIAKGADPNSKNYRGQPVLYAAALHGTIVLVKLLLEKGADVNALDVHGESALHAAAAEGSANVVKILAAGGAHIDAASRSGCTPLMFAAAGGRIVKIDDSGEVPYGRDGFLEVASVHGPDPLMRQSGDPVPVVAGEQAVSALIRLGANINATSEEGYTALWWAVAAQSLAKVRLLLKANANPNLNPKLNQPVLEMAIFKKQPEIVRELLAHHADPNYSDQMGITPLGAAIEWRQSAAAVMLLKAGADINKPSADPQGYGPGQLLARAIGKRDTDWTHFLLFHNADVNAAGGGALSAALRNRDISLVKEILDRHAKLNGLTGWGTRYGQDCLVPINYLSAQGGMVKSMDPEVLELLLAHGAWVNALNADGVDALFEAAQLKDSAPLRVLLRHGADPNSRNPKGVTALMIAADYRNVENVRLLLEAGADIEVRDSNRDTAFSHAAASLTGSFWRDSDLEICQLLLDRGAVVNNVDIDGRTPLILAVIGRDKNAVTYLLQHGANRAIKDYTGRPIYSGKMIDSGKTALEYAAEMKLTDIVKLLQDGGQQHQ